MFRHQLRSSRVSTQARYSQPGRCFQVRTLTRCRQATTSTPTQRLSAGEWPRQQHRHRSAQATQRVADAFDLPATKVAFSAMRTEPATVPENVRRLLPLLKAQRPHYIVTHIQGKPYLVTVGDTIRLPYRMPEVVPGDILRLNRATVLGSRDFTLKAGATTITGSSFITRDSFGEPRRTCTVDGLDVGLVPGAIKKTVFINDDLFECRAVVLGTETEPLRIIEKTARRQRRVKTVKSKHKYTILKIKELIVKDAQKSEEI